MQAERVYVGIDFSGNRASWSPRAREGNVWVAELKEANGAMILVGLRRVQELPGRARPFVRLAVWLAAGEFSAAAIDAPFSVPWWFFGQSLASHQNLVAAVDALPLGPAQDFPSGVDFVDRVRQDIPFQFTKPLRVTESYWRGRGVNVRSPVWCGVRPGAPFASACIKLLARVGRSIWPWAPPGSSPLVEAFPAAQLRQWQLPFQAYSGMAGQSSRRTILKHLRKVCRLQMSDAFQGALVENADALDSVLSCFAARAVVCAEHGVPLPPREAWQKEGSIAVHR
jgi:hypothetical protein